MTQVSCCCWCCFWIGSVLLFRIYSSFFYFTGSICPPQKKPEVTSDVLSPKRKKSKAVFPSASRQNDSSKMVVLVVVAFELAVNNFVTYIHEYFCFSDSQHPPSKKPEVNFSSTPLTSLGNGDKLQNDVSSCCWLFIVFALPINCVFTLIHEFLFFQSPRLLQRSHSSLQTNPTTSCRQRERKALLQEKDPILPLPQVYVVTILYFCYFAYFCFLSATFIQ